LYSKYCGQGANIYYERNTALFVEHITEALLRFPGAFDWLSDRQNGEPVTLQGCQTVSVSSNTVQADEKGLLAKGLIEALEAELFLPIGPLSIT